jgi:ketosteroid isomerase-like protein
MDENRNRLSEEEAVRKVVEDWAAAVRRRDLPAILRHHSPDILMFDVPPPFQSRGSRPTGRLGICFSRGRMIPPSSISRR